MKKNRKPRLTEDNLPIDAKEWTEDDWRTLHVHLEAIKKEVAERHKEPAESERK